uniref:Acetyl-CoA carboxylase 2 n=1 Tax=Cacopsylla melanoneura TaxID=428564 RepID=A0A8D8VZL8_9HEMI
MQSLKILPACVCFLALLVTSSTAASDIPQHLRGNNEQGQVGDDIEMYADPVSRGGVLEPEGIVEIKFRMKDLLKSMYRIDPVIISQIGAIAFNVRFPFNY